MPGTKPKNNTRQYSEKCQDADFRLRRKMLCRIRVLGRLLGEETFGAADSSGRQESRVGMRMFRRGITPTLSFGQCYLHHLSSFNL